MLTMEKRVLGTLPKGSWCSHEKALRMAHLIAERKPEIAVEIGVFGGDSLFVIAQAMQHIGFGKVYGIDPWDKEAAIAGMGEVNRAWWSTIDFTAKYIECRSKLSGFALQQRCELIRSTADDPDTLRRFADGSIGFFHHDGNHSGQGLSDVKLWLEKLAPSCVIFYDDVNWGENGMATNRPGFEYLLENGCELMVDDDGVAEMIGDCAVLRKQAS